MLGSLLALLSILVPSQAPIVAVYAGATPPPWIANLSPEEPRQNHSSSGLKVPGALTISQPEMVMIIDSASWPNPSAETLSDLLSELLKSTATEHRTLDSKSLSSDVQSALANIFSSLLAQVNPQDLLVTGFTLNLNVMRRCVVRLNGRRVTLSDTSSLGPNTAVSPIPLSLSTPPFHRSTLNLLNQKVDPSTIHFELISCGESKDTPAATLRKAQRIYAKESTKLMTSLSAKESDLVDMLEGRQRSHVKTGAISDQSSAVQSWMRAQLKTQIQQLVHPNNDSVDRYLAACKIVSAYDLPYVSLTIDQGNGSYPEIGFVLGATPRE